MNDQHPVNPAKAFLRRYRAILSRQQSLIRALNAVRDRQTDCTVKLRAVQVQSGWAGDRLAEEIVRQIDIEDQIIAQEQLAAAALAEIFEAIGSVQDDQQRAVLTLRYIEGLSWIEIQDRIGYERTQTLVIHGRGLWAVNQWLKERTKTESDL